MRKILSSLLVCLTLSSAAQSPVSSNVSITSEGVTLAAGPNIDGITYLHGAKLGEKEIKAFHEIPYIDSLSVRQTWAAIEPEDQKFDFSGYDAALDEVKKYNSAHPDSPRTLQIRAMGGRNCPRWMEQAGVKYYDTTDLMGPQRKVTPMRLPQPFDNPEFIKQQHELYAAMREHFANEPLVTVFHGTWSAGPWAELFYPQADNNQPQPPGATREKVAQGFIEQVDAVIDEFSMHGKVGELPLSGKYPQHEELPIARPCIDHVVERLGRRSPLFYFNTNGWGITTQKVQTISWGHEADVNYAYGKINLCFQALGTNTGGGWGQGDWLPLIQMAKQYDTGYLEIYTPDFMADETDTHFKPAITDYREYIQRRHRTLYLREGVLVKTFTTEKPLKIERIMKADAIPAGTGISYQIRVKQSGEWGEWKALEEFASLPECTAAQIEARLHTDDGYITPKIATLAVDSGTAFDPPIWHEQFTTGEGQ